MSLNFRFPNQNDLITLIEIFMNDSNQDVVCCHACGCKMNVATMEPFTNVVCPDCGAHMRVKCELGHYLLMARYAAGGMSMVFAARDKTLERDVAIKILNEKYSRDVKRMEEFEREAKITAALTNPHIVRVFTVGKSFGCYFIAMEMVSGGNLEEKIRKRGAVKEEEMLPIVLEIIEGLRAAKLAGVIHRDVKPGNILFDQGGRVKIVDFGLALVTMGGTVTADEIWATPHYVPPEALDGREEDFRSDIYALGATLYHALSGKLPLPDEVKSTREVRKAKEHIPPLAEVAPWLNAATCRMVDKAMALRPEDRFSSYVKMEKACNVALQVMRNGGAEEPIRSQNRLQRRVKRQTKLFVFGGGLVAIIAGIVALSVLRQTKETEKPNSASSETDVKVSDAGGDYDPERAARVGRKLRASHELLRQKKYKEAQNAFVSLMSDSDIKEPLPSWLRVESLVAVFLEGDPESIGRALRELRLHWRKQNDGGGDPLLKLERDLTSMGVIRKSEVGTDPMQIIQLMAVALKNWELGAFDEAVPFFRKAMTHPLSAKNPLVVYREVAQLYLDDYQILKSLDESAKIEGVEQGKLQLEVLNRSLKSLKTRGRGRFYIRVLQLRAHRNLKRFREQGAGEQGDGKKEE